MRGPPETAGGWKVIKECRCGLQAHHCYPKQEENSKEDEWSRTSMMGHRLSTWPGRWEDEIA